MDGRAECEIAKIFSRFLFFFVSISQCTYTAWLRNYSFRSAEFGCSSLFFFFLIFPRRLVVKEIYDWNALRAAQDI